MSEREQCAKLIQEMIEQPIWAARPWARMALAVAATTIRRGRHLTEAEKINNLADSMAEADAENGTNESARAVEILRNLAGTSGQSTGTER
jgi:hypothetical protein